MLHLFKIGLLPEQFNTKFRKFKISVRFNTRRMVQQTRLITNRYVFRFGTAVFLHKKKNALLNNE